MKNAALFFCLGIFSCLASCKDKHMVPLRISPNPPVHGMEVKFSTAFSPGCSYTWDFGDGHTQNSLYDTAVTHVYEQAGMYVLTLSLADEAHDQQADGYNVSSIQVR